MLSSNHRRRAVAALAGLGLAGSLFAGAGSAAAQQSPTPTPIDAPNAFGLTTKGKIITFELDRPTRVLKSATLRLPTRTVAVGLDERPKTGELYVVLRNTRTGAGSFAIVNPATGRLGTVTALTAPTTGAPIILNGTNFGVDFNPVADALRIVSDTGQNLRAFPTARPTATPPRVQGETITDGTLSYSAISASPRPAALGINASAYTNNLDVPIGVNGAPAVATDTTLYNIDSNLGDLTKQTSPNDGTQAKQADLSPALGGRTVQGFDILTAPGQAVPVNPYSEYGYVALSLPVPNYDRANAKYLRAFGRSLPPTPSELFQIDLVTGELTKVGLVGGQTLIDFTIDTTPFVSGPNCVITTTIVCT